MVKNIHEIVVTITEDGATIILPDTRSDDHFNIDGWGTKGVGLGAISLFIHYAGKYVTTDT